MNIPSPFPLIFSLIAVACAPVPRFVIHDRTVVSDSPSSYIEEGVASYYAEDFHGQRTSSGEVFDMNQLTAAHQTLPFGTIARVTNKLNGRSVVVRINDRGPFLKDRIIDLSRAAAEKIGMIGPGTVEVRVEVLEWGLAK